MTKFNKSLTFSFLIAVLFLLITSCSKKAHDRYNRCPAFSKNTAVEKVIVSRNG